MFVGVYGRGGLILPPNSVAARLGSPGSQIVYRHVQELG
jgi:hypothetical protein